MTWQYNCIGIDSVRIDLMAVPIVDAGGDTAFCTGSSIQLQVSGAVSYLWTPGNFLSDSTVSDPVAFPPTTTQFFVTGTGLNGCTAVDSVLVDVLPLPAVQLSSDTSICLGQTHQLNVAGGVSQVWSPSSTLSCSTCPDPIASPTSTTTYTVTVTGANGCQATDAVTVSVNPLPPVTTSSDTSVCISTTLPLWATGGLNYQWSPSTGLSDPNIANPQATVTGSLTYTVRVTDLNGCEALDSVTIIALPLPVITASGDTTLCEGDAVQMNASGGLTYQWTPLISLTCTSCPDPISIPVVSTTYTVTGTDINGCSNTDSVQLIVLPLPNVVAGNDTAICSGNSVQLSVSGALNYAWTPQNPLSCSTCPDPIATPTVTTNFFVSGTDINGCNNLDTVNVAVLPLPNVIASGDATICMGTNIQLTATGASSYSWSPQSSLSCTNCPDPVATPTLNTTYTVTGTDVNGCQATDTVNVVVNQAPTISVTGDTVVCSGESVQLNASGGVNYSWLPAGSLSNPMISNPIANPASTTVYTVTVVDANGCTGIDSVAVTILTPLSPNPAPSTSICLGDQVQLSAQNGVNYQWAPSASLDNPSISSPIASPVVTTQYTVTITDIQGCLSSDSVIITVNPLPVVDAGNDQSIIKGQSILLQGTGASSYVWFPVTWLSDPFVSAPVASPPTTTVYYVTGTDNNGCSATDSITVFVLGEVSVYIPTAFSPNDDGVNDKFSIAHIKELELVSLKIYNRYGRAIYETKDKTKGWDGNFKGKQQPIGTYVYIIKVLTPVGEQVIYSGNVTLLR